MYVILLCTVTAATALQEISIDQSHDIYEIYNLLQCQNREVGSMLDKIKPPRICTETLTEEAEPTMTKRRNLIMRLMCMMIMMNLETPGFLIQVRKTIWDDYVELSSNIS